MLMAFYRNSTEYLTEKHVNGILPEFYQGILIVLKGI